jgi:hypothetical protein
MGVIWNWASIDPDSICSLMIGVSTKLNYTVSATKAYGLVVYLPGANRIDANSIS